MSAPLTPTEAAIEAADLIPCGLCGGKPREKNETASDDQHTRFYVQCLNCATRSNGAYGRTDANAQWNQVMSRGIPYFAPILAERDAQMAVMREILESVPCSCAKGKSVLGHNALCRICKALLPTAGRELLEEVERLRKENAELKRLVEWGTQ